MPWTESPTTSSDDDSGTFSPQPSRTTRSSLELKKELDSLIILQSTFSSEPTPIDSQYLFQEHKDGAARKIYKVNDETWKLANQVSPTDASPAQDYDNKICSELSTTSDSPSVSPRPPAKEIQPEPGMPSAIKMASEMEDMGEKKSEDMGEERIQVICRVRPAKAEDGRCLSVSETDVGLMVLLAQPPIPFKFDYVAGEDSSQEEVFARVGRPLAQAVLRGYNATCFAYGQTGSGKVTALCPIHSRFILVVDCVRLKITHNSTFFPAINLLYRLSFVSIRHTPCSVI